MLKTLKLFQLNFIIKKGVRFDPDLPQTLRLEFAKSNTKVQKPKQLNSQQQQQQQQQQHQNAVAAQMQSAHTLIPLNRECIISYFV